MVTEGASLLNQILGVVLVSFRVGAFWMFFPIFGDRQVNATIRLFGALALAIGVFPAVAPNLQAWSFEHLPKDWEIINFAIREITIGLCMGTIARMVFWAALSAAQWTSVQIGFTAGAAVDPTTGSDGHGWPELNNWMVIMLFFSVGGHYWLLQALVDSYSFSFSNFYGVMSSGQSAQFWIDFGKELLSWVVRLSGPLVVVILAIQFSFGILSRFVPQINIWSVSVPVTLAVGIFTFSALSPFYGDALKEAFHRDQQIIYRWLKHTGGELHGR